MTIPQRVVLAGLACLAVLQFAANRYSATRSEGKGPVGVIQVGDSVADVNIAGGSGSGNALPEPGAVVSVVFAFSSECTHCASVAPAWAEWMRRPHAGVRVLAVSPEPLDAAQSYASRWAWSAEVASTRLDTITDRARRLTSRTPWLFLLDRGGRVLFEAHGARLTDLDLAIVALTR